MQADLLETVKNLRAMSVRGLARMYLPNERMFCHCIRRGPMGDIPEGISRRYTAITLIGLATECTDAARSACGDTAPGDVCGRLLEDIDHVENMGDVALTLWAAVLWDHADKRKAFDRLLQLDPSRGAHPTVEIAWALTALSVKNAAAGDLNLAGKVCKRLLSAFHRETGVFPHWPKDAPTSALRGHVSCFADMVYPVQALSCYAQTTSDSAAITAAKQAGEHMVRNQGPAGQWWWHFDARSGRVVEGFPVYTVHQDSMAPMALFALQDAGGPDSSAAINEGLRWLIASPEIDGRTLIDNEADLIWRKVARHEPGKLTRGVQAVASRIHPSMRAPGVNMLFRPGFVDYECRPYHLGWILHAFTPERLATWDAKRTTG